MTTIGGMTPGVAPGQNDQLIPVVEENVRVEKRTVESGRTSIRIAVSEHDQAVETLLMRQDVTVERVPVGHQVDAAPATRREGDTFIIPVLEEIVVVEKRLFLKEELRICINESQHIDTQVVHLRREHAEIGLDGAAAEVTPTRSQP